MMIYLRLLRTEQYHKNAFVFIPLFFAARADNADALLFTCIAFVAFCLISSSVYILNDLSDKESDRLHPQKQARPIASGAISVKAALNALTLLLTGAYLLAWFSAIPKLLIVLTGYFIINATYSLWLKHVPIADILVVAAGFLLRLVAGAQAAAVPLSSELTLITILLAVLVTIGKRYEEVRLLGPESVLHRPVLRFYPLPLLQSVVILTAMILLFCYAWWAFSQQTAERLGTEFAWVSLILVIPGLYRYLYLTLKLNKGGDPTRMLITDHLLITLFLAWIVLFGNLIYFAV